MGVKKGGQKGVKMTVEVEEGGEVAVRGGGA